MAKHTKLSELPATAICGNDILSSCLYVSGIAISIAGIWAPIVLILVAFVLFFYKSVYTEVVEALPINGGAYNGLLNGTSKIVAAIAGVMTALSYTATAVISAKVGVEYLSTLYKLDVIQVTVFILIVFAILNIFGLKDSSRVATFIFIFHILTLSIILAFGIYHIYTNNTQLFVNINSTSELFRTNGNMPYMQIFLAFCASLLGVSGFESSANFVEEQKNGVFRKTLRNMFIGVLVFNPLISLIILGTLSISEITLAKDFVLSLTSFRLGGEILQYLTVINAFTVLSGAVLSSFIGVSGLLSRMAGDGCIPEYFAYKNKHGSFTKIIILFTVICSSILIITRGNLLSLAGLYTIAFLSVMSLYALGNLILKETRSELKRYYKAPIVYVIMAFIATLSGIFGNIYLDSRNIIYFAIYFIPSALVVFTVVYMDYILRFALKYLSFIKPIKENLQNRFNDIISGQFVIFIHNAGRLYPALEYVRKNETGTNVTIVHCKPTDNSKDVNNQNKELERLIPELQKAGAFTNFKINFLYKNMTFGPEVINSVSKELKIHKNRILIGSIHHTHDFDYSELGGVRIIF